MTGRRVLVVDDESDIRMSVGLALQLAGYDVIEAATGADAVRCVLEASPDAILLDLRLPDVDGWTVLERLEEAGCFPQVPVVIGSADAAPASRRRALAAGCAGYLVKPFEPDALLALLEQPASR